MNKSYLIQRLTKPQPWKIMGKKVDNPFTFGGGLINGGLSKEAMDLTRDIWSYDYMGASEFEWGIIPKTLQDIVKDLNKIKAFTLNVIYKIPIKHKRGKIVKNKKLKNESTVYVICRNDDISEVSKRITSMALNEYNKGFSTKEWVGLNTALSDNKEDKKRHPCGWLELDNGYMFFTDKDMYIKTCELFGLKPEE